MSTMIELVRVFVNTPVESLLRGDTTVQPFELWLRDRLHERGWKQADFVRASGGTLKGASVSKWMRGTSKPEDHTLIAAIAGTLRISEEEVWRAIRELEPPQPAEMFADVSLYEALILRRLLVGLRDGLQEVRERYGTDASALRASTGAGKHPTQADIGHPPAQRAGRRVTQG
jgi:transcriptional regulator with XRE-family HTH domain